MRTKFWLHVVDKWTVGPNQLLGVPDCFVEPCQHSGTTRFQHHEYSGTTRLRHHELTPPHLPFTVIGAAITAGLACCLLLLAITVVIVNCAGAGATVDPCALFANWCLMLLL